MLVWVVVVRWVSGGILGLIEGHLVETLVVRLKLVVLEWLMKDVPLVEEFGVYW